MQPYQLREFSHDAQSSAIAFTAPPEVGEWTMALVLVAPQSAAKCEYVKGASISHLADH